MYLQDHQHLRMNYLQAEKQVAAQVRSECKERNPQIFNFLFKFSINPPSISLTLHGSIWVYLIERQGSSLLILCYHALHKLLIWLKWHLTRFMFWTNKLKRITRIKWKKILVIQVYFMCNLLKTFGFLPDVKCLYD